MLEPPSDVQNEQIIACLQSEYDVAVTEIAFLPIGTDANTAVYRVVTNETTPYFLKLRRGAFSEASVTVPHWLAERGMPYVIPPLATQTGSLWAKLGPVNVILYPFVAGRSGWDVNLSAQQWIEFGCAMRALHTAVVPSTLTRSLPSETYTATYRRQVTALLRQASTQLFEDLVAKELANLLRAKHVQLFKLLRGRKSLPGRLRNNS